MSVTARPRALAALNLTAILAVVGLAELLLYRTMMRLLLPSPAAGPVWNRVLSTSATFAFHLTGTLGLVVLTGSLGRLLRRRELFPAGMRISMSLIGLVFVALSALGVLVTPLNEANLLHARTSQAFLVVLIWAAVLRSPALTRRKLGLLPFALGTILGAAALFAESTGAMGGRWPSPGAFGHAADIMALLAAVGAPWLLAEHPRHGRFWGPAAGVAMAIALLALLITRFDFMQAAFLYGLRIDIPRPVHPAAVFEVALIPLAAAGATSAAVASFTAGGAARLLAYGIVLVAVAGPGPPAPHQLLLSLTGMLALAVGSSRIASKNGDDRAAP